MHHTYWGQVAGGDQLTSSPAPANLTTATQPCDRWTLVCRGQRARVVINLTDSKDVAFMQPRAQGISSFIGAVVIVILSLSPQPVDAADRIVNKELAFTLELPDGLETVDDLSAYPDNVVHVFLTRKSGTDEPEFMVIIQRLSGLLPRTRIQREQFPADFQGRLFEVTWQDFKLVAGEVQESAGDERILTYNVPIPLKPAAINIKVIGPADRESALKELLSQTLAGLSGESSWQTPTNRGFVAIATIVLAVVGGIMLWIGSRRMPKGGALLIAIAIYASSFATNQLPVRHAMAITFALRFFGGVAIVIGIIDLFRKRRQGATDLSANGDIKDP